MTTVFASSFVLSATLAGTLGLAVGAGILTFFAPCSYALLPGYVGYYVAATGEEAAPLSGALVRGLSATAGVLAVFATLSVVAVVASDAVQSVLPVVEPLVGVVLVGLGLAVLYGGMGTVHVVLPRRRATVSGFALFGAMYALASTACFLPVFMGIVLQSLTLSPAGTALVLGGYAASFGVFMLAATVAIAVGHSFGTERLAGNVDRLVRLAGVVLVLAGIGQLYVALVVNVA